MRRLLRLQQICWLPMAIVLAITANAQTITGTINDASGQPLSGVSIIEKGTSSGVSSKSDGTYNIIVSSSKAILVYSFVGYSTKEITTGSQTIINLVLSADDIKLDQVVVIGYGTQRKKDLTGSVTSIKGSDLRQVPSVNAIKSMQGLVAGVDIASPNSINTDNTFNNI